MSDLTAILQSLKGWTPLATALGLVIAALYFRVFRLGKDYTDMEADKNRQIQELKASNDRLWDLTLRTAGLVEGAVYVNKRKAE